MESLLLILLKLLYINIILSSFITKKSNKINDLKNDVLLLSNHTSLINQSNYIMFWRPQKVGSSTVLALFLSYSFRYNVYPRPKIHKNGFCSKIALCLYNNNSKYNLYNKYDFILSDSITKSIDKYFVNTIKVNKNIYIAEKIPFIFSLNHEICNIPGHLIQSQLECAFKGRYVKYKGNYQFNTNADIKSNVNTKEIFIVRDPIDRMISIYYFWGELYKISKHKQIISIGNKIIKSSSNTTMRIGKTNQTFPVKGSLFTYHGDEYTVPPIKIANDFVNKFPLTIGIPGPSYTWSFFSNKLEDAIAILSTNRIFTIVTERLEESLLCLSHYLNWSIADIIIVKPRKALSSHPKQYDWPEDVINNLKSKLIASGEYMIYNKANELLDYRIKQLKLSGYPFDYNLQLLKAIRSKVANICLLEDYLQSYKVFIESKGFNKHSSNNKLRDTLDQYNENGHVFSLNGDILYSYDICSSCESHFIIDQLDRLIYSNVSDIPRLLDSKTTVRSDDINFINCPR